MSMFLLCAWVMLSMEAEPGGSFLYKPVSEPMSSEHCRQLVREKTTRGPLAPIGTLAWYKIPGSAGFWYGCWPQEFDPYERR